MKKLKRLLSIMLTMAMVLAMNATVFATNQSSHETAEHTITITNTKAGHQYTAYQIFKGDIYVENNQKILSNVKWGSGILSNKTDDLINELGSNDAFKILASKEGSPNQVNVFEKATTAADVAKALGDIQADSGLSTAQKDALADKFSEIVGKTSRDFEGNIVYEYLNTTEGKTSSPKNDAPTTYTINVIGDGYYFVKDTGTIAEGDAATRYILQVVGDVSVAAKADAPILEKDIDQTLTCTDTSEGHKHVRSCYKEHVKFNNGALGDTVPFSITSKVPKMDGYEKYFFVVQDKMEPGLTFNNDLTVTVNGELLTDNTGKTTDKATTKSYHVNMYKEVTITGDDGKKTTKFESTTDSSEARMFEVVFENFIQYKSNTYEGKDIVISYTATINENVHIGPTGEMNEAKLIYSNNPNVTGDGEDDEPDYPKPDAPTGETPEKITRTYVAGLKLKKVDENGNSLKGAKFKVSAKVLNKILIAETTYKEREETDTVDTAGPVYYKLKDGTYTTTAPVISSNDTVDTTKYYEHINANKEITTTYKLVTGSKTSQPSTSEGTGEDATQTYTAYVGDDGILKLEGLAAGTYTFEELEAPNGYNLLEKPFTIKLDWNATSPNEDCVWTATKDDEPDNNNNETSILDYEKDLDGKITDNSFIFNVVNKKGSLLPSTGGIGTTIFYIVGGILVLGAAILLITKKRVSKEV